MNEASENETCSSYREFVRFGNLFRFFERGDRGKGEGLAGKFRLSGMRWSKLLSSLAYKGELAACPTLPANILGIERLIVVDLEQAEEIWGRDGEVDGMDRSVTKDAEHVRMD